jgi:hypothetical protein
MLDTTQIRLNNLKAIDSIATKIQTCNSKTETNILYRELYSTTRESILRAIAYQVGNQQQPRDIKEKILDIESSARTLVDTKQSFYSNFPTSIGIDESLDIINICPQSIDSALFNSEIKNLLKSYSNIVVDYRFKLQSYQSLIFAFIDNFSTEVDETKDNMRQTSEQFDDDISRIQRLLSQFSVKNEDQLNQGKRYPTSVFESMDCDMNEITKSIKIINDNLHKIKERSDSLHGEKFKHIKNELIWGKWAVIVEELSDLINELDDVNDFIITCSRIISQVIDNPFVLQSNNKRITKTNDLDVSVIDEEQVDENIESRTILAKINKLHEELNSLYSEYQKTLK